MSLLKYPYILILIWDKAGIGVYSSLSAIALVLFVYVFFLSLCPFCLCVLFVYVFNKGTTILFFFADPRFYLQQDMNSLHPLLLSTGDDEVNSQVHKLLVRLGVKQLSPFDIINHHIIPVLKSGEWEVGVNVVVPYESAFRLS